ncbi:hypothetical protein ScPMuIL_014632 [Solemya velum]
MASFVAEVLTSAGQQETQEVLTTLQQLSKKVENSKIQLYDAITNKYVDFSPTFKTTEEMVESFENLSKEIHSISDKIQNEIKNQLNLSTGEFQVLSCRLKEVTAVQTILQKLVKIQDNMECVSSAHMTQKYVSAANAIISIHDLLAAPVHDAEKEIKIMSALQTEYRVQKEKFIFDLGDKWKEMVIWEIPTDANKTCELRIVGGSDRDIVLSEIVQAMAKMVVLDRHLNVFGERVLNCFVKPLLASRDSVIKDASSGHLKVLQISPNEAIKEEHPTPQELFPKLLKILNFLNQNLLNITVDLVDCDGQEYKCGLMEKLNELHVADKILQSVVQDCLSHAIPSCSRDLEGFAAIIEKTEGFQTQLLNMKFVSDSNSILTDYVHNVNVLYANKKCQCILEKAQQLLKSEVHNTVLVCDDKPLGDLPNLGSDGPGAKKQRKIELSAENRLSTNTFRFPTCRISACVQQLMYLAYETLHEATDSSEQCAIQLFYAVRNLFELFCSVFPTYHRQSLASLPQLTALHHNNCMFIAHHLITLGHQFRTKLPHALNPTFVDLVTKVRRIGTESFLEQLSTQKNQLLESLNGAKGFNSVSEDEGYFDAEKAIKQALHQLNHLQNIWQDVLPLNIYKKAMGTLLNSVIEEIINCIVVLEDISADDAQQLSTLLTVVTDRAGTLFTAVDVKVNTTVELQRNVRRWQKLQELNIILNASLHEISDRWADGKGPLAIEFSANELKQLIRALFQNTDRRAAVLVKIR